MVSLLVSMYVVSAALPLFGLIRLALGAHEGLAELRRASPLADGSNGSRAQMNAMVGPLADFLLSRPRAALVDLALIGVGLVVGATASIMSLFVG
ncbi:hypothetical protein [Microbacterium album]|uniref:Uncharacterized protein n=1 Tax=Microbacterium album TaxID=2053191 RepID=A0A917IC09_9MICO|nr:hypothetical protein [Microbacterium album]GGH34133.1 hypothetical protein GCM10010921_01600 [Microbacterium album]